MQKVDVKLNWFFSNFPVEVLSGFAIGLESTEVSGGLILNWSNVTEVLRGLGRPGVVFEERPQVSAFLWSILAIIIACAAALVLTRFFYSEPLVQPRPGDLALNNPDAFTRLQFPLHFCIYVGFGAMVRWIGVSIFGESNRSLTELAFISAFAALPLFLMATFIGLINNLIPYGFHGASAGLTSGRILGTVLLLLAAYGWEGWICTTGLRRWFGQNPGRAVVTWLLPPILLALMMAPLLFIVQFARV